MNSNSKCSSQFNIHIKEIRVRVKDIINDKAFKLNLKTKALISFIMIN
jgi:hypothetical protein